MLFNYTPNHFDLFRRVVEINIAIAWIVAAVVSAWIALLSGYPLHLIWPPLCVLLSLSWLHQAFVVLSFRFQLHAGRLASVSIHTMISSAELALYPDKASFAFAQGTARGPSLWLGDGFIWEPRHTQIAAQLLNYNRADSEILSPAVQSIAYDIKRWMNSKPPGYLINRLWAAAQTAMMRGTMADRSPMGQPWIHAMEPNRHATLFPLAAMPGHTLIVGAPGSGKTRLYEVLTTQIIRMVDTAMIVIDPKGDVDWQNRIWSESERVGREPLYFHLAHLDQSIRLNPLANYNQPSEIASRISQLLVGDDGANAFVQFAYLSIDRAVQGMINIGIRPTLRSILQSVQSGVGDILETTLERLFNQHLSANWEDEVLKGYMLDSSGKGRQLPRSQAMAAMYLNHPPLKGVRDPSANGLLDSFIDWDGYNNQGANGQVLAAIASRTSSDVINGLISMVEHNKEHYGKMILSLLPMLQALCSGELGLVLSPEPDDGDPRPIYNLRQIIEEKRPLYIGLSTLSNSVVGRNIGSIFLAELAAVAGHIYDFGAEQRKSPAKIFLIVDEAYEVVNDMFIQVLNKGRGAGFNTFFAVQTLADFETKFGSRAKAMQLLGNTNNLIALRVQDTDTAKYISEKFGETSIEEVNVSTSQGAESDALLLDVRGNVSTTFKKTKTMLVPPELLFRLPNMHCFTQIAGGTASKVRIPLISN